MPKADVNGLNMYYEVHGHGEPLILVAGMGVDHRAWFPQIGSFKRYYKVITFDGRGIGKTDRPTDVYTFATLAKDVVSLMDHLSVESADVLGESLGGLIAQETAIQFPERVKKLVLVNTSAGAAAGMGVHPELLKSYDQPGGPTEGDFDPGKVNVDQAMRAIIALAFNRPIYRTAMMMMASFYVKSSAFQGMGEQIKAISTHSTLDRLHLIQSPTLVICGTGDRIVPPRMSDILVSGIPKARLVKIEGGSHALHLEMRGRFNKEVLAFLREA